MAFLRPKKTITLVCLLVVAGLAGAFLYQSQNSQPPPRLLGEQTTSQPSARSTSLKAFDSANTIADPKWFKEAYNEGFRLYILNTVYWGTCNPWPPAQEQIKSALAAGLKVAAYTRDPQCWQNGILASGNYQSELQFFALDIEKDPGVPLTKAMIEGVRAMGVRPVVYSGAHMWGKLMGEGNDEFSDLPLWDTNESQFDYSVWEADYLQPWPIAYGGWNSADNMRIGIQQQFEYTLNGINIDLNSFNSEFLR